MSEAIAILLAGGKGQRLGRTGRLQPKPLVHIGDEPVINTMVDKLLSAKLTDGTDAVRTVYVLLRKKQKLDKIPEDPIERPRDLQTHFDGWKSVWYGDDSRVQLVYEDELDPENSITGDGAIAGLYRFFNADQHLSADDKRIRDGERVVVAAADNYFPDDDLTSFIQKPVQVRTRDWPEISVVAYRDMRDPEAIRGKFGCIFLDRENVWVESFEEKPAEVTERHRFASLGIYNFSYKHFAKIAEYAAIETDKDAPGHYLAWLISQFQNGFARQRVNGVRGYKLIGDWFDIGNPTDLKITLFWYTHNVLGQLKTVEDILVARATRRTDDRSFLVCRRLSISSKDRVIRMFFQTADPLCSLREDGRNLDTVETIATSGDRHFWNNIERILTGKGSIDYVNTGELCELEVPFLISGGVFLFDTGGSLDVNGKTLLPLFEKDYASRIDPRRITSAVGRMDDLDFQQVCLDELFEEFIFYGRELDSEKMRIFSPQYHREMESGDMGRGRELAERILTKGFFVPGIDEQELEDYLGGRNTGLIVDVPTRILELPEHMGWSVEVYLGAGLPKRMSDYTRIRTRSNFMVIPDAENNTMEFRLLCAANISGNRELNENRMQIGRLRGIIDGDGFRRVPLLIEADELAGYYQKITSNQCRKDELLCLLNESQSGAVILRAVGDGATGQFTRFDARIPALFMTSSVAQLAQSLPHLL